MSQDTEYHPRRPIQPESGSPFLQPAAENQPSQIDQEKVARARKLLQQDGYPSDQVIQAVARHLADQWSDARHPSPLPSRDQGPS